METKFKVWDKAHNKMFMPEEIARLHFNDGKCYGVLTWSEEMILHFDLLPFTGILDGDKKEIYKGDLVQYTYLINGDSHKTWIQEVFWNDESAGFHIRPATLYSSTPLYYSDKRKILGSIYENPDIIIGTVDGKKKRRSK